MNVAVLQVDWHSERPSRSVRMHAKSRPSLRIVENVVRTMIPSTSFMIVISRCQITSSVSASSAGRSASVGAARSSPSCTEPYEAHGA